MGGEEGREQVEYRLKETSKEFLERGMVGLAPSSMAIPCDMYLKVLKCTFHEGYKMVILISAS